MPLTFRVVEGRRIQLLGRAQQNLTPLLERIGSYLVRLSQAAFQNQRFGGQDWAARSVPSILGAVADLSTGPTIRPERFQQRRALVNTGALRRSIIFRITGPKSVEVGSSSPYAHLHDQGGSASAAVTPTVKQNLAEWLRGNRAWRPKLGFLFRRSRVNSAIPARSFLGVPPAARPKVQEIIRNFLTLKKGSGAPEV